MPSYRLGRVAVLILERRPLRRNNFATKLVSYWANFEPVLPVSGACGLVWLSHLGLYTRMTSGYTCTPAQASLQSGGGTLALGKVPQLILMYNQELRLSGASCFLKWVQLYHCYLCVSCKYNSELLRVVFSLINLVYFLKLSKPTFRQVYMISAMEINYSWYN